MNEFRFGGEKGQAPLLRIDLAPGAKIIYHDFMEDDDGVWEDAMLLLNASAGTCIHLEPGWLMVVKDDQGRRWRVRFHGETEFSTGTPWRAWTHVAEVRVEVAVGDTLQVEVVWTAPDIDM